MANSKKQIQLLILLFLKNIPPPPIQYRQLPVPVLPLLEANNNKNMVHQSIQGMIVLNIEAFVILHSKMKRTLDSK